MQRDVVDGDRDEGWAGQTARNDAPAGGEEHNGNVDTTDAVGDRESEGGHDVPQAAVAAFGDVTGGLVATGVYAWAQTTAQPAKVVA